MTIDEIKDVCRAIADDRPVQYRLGFGWADVYLPNHTIDFVDNVYRVKPVKHERWVLMDRFGISIVAGPYTSKDSAERDRRPLGKEIVAHVTWEE